MEIHKIIALLVILINFDLVKTVNAYAKKDIMIIILWNVLRAIIHGTINNLIRFSKTCSGGNT